jgi:hypothetical protein
LDLTKEFLSEKPFCRFARKKSWRAFDGSFFGATMDCITTFQWIKHNSYHDCTDFTFWELLIPEWH